MKTVLITGASTGIGKATAIEFANKGHKVFACVRKEADFNDLKAASPQIIPIYLDVTQTDQIVKAMNEVKSLTDGHLDVLVNNAGIAVAGPLEAVPMDRWKQQIDTNVVGLVETTQAFLPLIRKAKGRVINVGSISGFIGTPFLSPYAATKFAVRGISDSLRRELLPVGVKVSLIEPGPIKTPIWQKSLDKVKELEEELSQEMLDVYGPSIEKVQRAFDGIEDKAVEVKQVVDAIDHAAFSKKPQIRYLVGKGKPILALMRVLPPRLLDPLILRARG